MTCSLVIFYLSTHWTFILHTIVWREQSEWQEAPHQSFQPHQQQQYHQRYQRHSRCITITQESREQVHVYEFSILSFLVLLLLLLVLHCSLRKFGSPYLGETQQPQEQGYPFLSVCAVFSCVPTMVWLPMFRIFNVCTEVNARSCTWGLYRHWREHWKLTGRKIPCRIRDLNPHQYCAWFVSQMLYQLMVWWCPVNVGLGRGVEGIASKQEKNYYTCRWSVVEVAGWK